MRQKWINDRGVPSSTDSMKKGRPEGLPFRSGLAGEKGLVYQGNAPCLNTLCPPLCPCVSTAY